MLQLLHLKDEVKVREGGRMKQEGGDKQKKMLGARVGEEERPDRKGGKRDKERISEDEPTDQVFVFVPMQTKAFRKSL